MLLPEDICYGCGNDHRACTCARPAPVTQHAPVAEPLRPSDAADLAAFLRHAAERGGDVALTSGGDAIHMPAAMALSLDVAAAVAAERAAVVAYLRRRAYVSDPPVAGALRAAADDVEAAMHREGT